MLYRNIIYKSQVSRALLLKTDIIQIICCHITAELRNLTKQKSKVILRIKVIKIIYSQNHYHKLLYKNFHCPIKHKNALMVNNARMRQKKYENL